MTPSIVSERLVNRSVELHRCKVCGTRWLLWPDALHGGGWNLLDKYQRPGACCDNAAMSDQIEHLRDLPLGVVPAPAPQEEQEASPSSCVVGYRVENDDDGDWHILVFGDGVQRRIFTRNPLVIVQPERH